MAEIGGGVGEERVVAPERRAVGAPPAAEGPARERFTGVPFADAVVEEPAGAEAGAELADELGGEEEFAGAEGGGVPFFAVGVIDADEGGFAAHGQADIAADERGIDLAAEGVDGVPLVVGVGESDARGFVDPLDGHLEVEGDIGWFDGTGDGGGALGVRGGGEGEVAFAGEETGGGVETDPASAWEVDLAPRVEVGEVASGTFRAVERSDVGAELDEVAGDEA